MNVFGIGLLFVLLVGCSLFEPVLCGDPAFTTEPKSREVFVGEDVQFDWGFSNDDNQKLSLSYGYVNGSIDHKIVTKDLASEVLTWNDEVDKSVRDRIKVKRIDTGLRASMKIKSVQMTDQKRYYCSMSWDLLEPQPTSYVSLRVVDLQITDESDSKKESWKGKTIMVHCAVKVPDGVPVTFTWKRETVSRNQTLPRDKQVDTNTQSELTLFTFDDEDFDDLLCFAKTSSTQKVRRIKIERLFLPDPPLNLKSTKVFENERSINRLYWDKPRNNGGSEVFEYVIQYKPDGITNWDQAQEESTTKKEFKKLQLTYGKKYNVHVRAVNGVGRSQPSNEVDVEDPIGNGNPQPRGHGVQLASDVRTTLLAWCIACAVMVQPFFP